MNIVQTTMELQAYVLWFFLPGPTTVHVRRVLLALFIMGNILLVVAQTRVGKNVYVWSELNLTCTK